MDWVIWFPEASEAATWTVYVPGDTFAVCGLVVPVVPVAEEPPPHAEILVMSRSAAKQINAAARFRFRSKGIRKRNPASATPNPPVHSSAAVWVDSLETESVKFAAVPPITARLAGTKVEGRRWRDGCGEAMGFEWA